VLDILKRLDDAKIAYTISYHRSDAVSICATVPGERWEIDVLSDGEIDFERFVSDGHLGDPSELETYILKFTDTDEAPE